MKRLITALVVGAFLLCSTGCGMSKKAHLVQDAIDELPSSYSLNDDDAIENVRTAYQALDDMQRSYIDAQKLDNLTNERDSIKSQAESINKEIENLSIRVDDESQIEKTSDQMLELSKKIEEFPSEYDELIDYDLLFDKYQSFMHGLVEVSNEYTNDLDHIENAINLNGEFIDAVKVWVRSMGSSAYVSGMTSAMSECKKELKKVKRVDVDDAISLVSEIEGKLKKLSGLKDMETVGESDVKLIESLDAANDAGLKEALGYNVAASGKSMPGLSRAQELLKDRGGHADIS